ncbi:LamB/YcsF family protein [Aneurinibacillus sp. BA2021]|nr:LamB/YcsF family protein [Aneurinibacillus sp. BA2021]
MKIDINCDMGESFGMYELGNDEEMMKYVSTINVACGYHAGDPLVMRRTVELAKQHGINVGAHPGFPDLMGFGRRRMTATAEEVENYILYQVGALQAFLHAYDMQLSHIKPHGAMYMMAMEHDDLAQAVLNAAEKIDKRLPLFALNNSALARLGQEQGFNIVFEVYADREHDETGGIVMTRKGADYTDMEERARRVLRMCKEGRVVTHDGKDIELRAETVCIHGDHPDAPKLAQAIIRLLDSEGVERNADFFVQQA